MVYGLTMWANRGGAFLLVDSLGKELFTVDTFNPFHMFRCSIVIHFQ